MKTDYPKYIISIISTILITWTISCSGRPGIKREAEILPVSPAAEEAAARFIKIVTPGENEGSRLHDPLEVVLELIHKEKSPDSVLIVFNGKTVSTIRSAPWSCTVASDFNDKTGRKSIKVTAYRGGKMQSPITRFVIIFSDVVPKRNGYKVINSYPHDRYAFTQGLIFDNGILYESTGQESASSLREVELETGKIIRQLNLESSLFGEGITIYRDRIYHVTWTNKVGFVYEKSSFNLINKVYYNTQGWGLTTVNDNIVMSDGTEVLHFFEPEMFTVVSRIEVYDNEKKIDSLNELEYINGEIWANIWMSDLIARIDPKSGKVIAYIDLKGLLPEHERTADTDVLNGIAYDHAGGRLFVTGKKWPKLYEIRITE